MLFFQLNGYSQATQRGSTSRQGQLGAQRHRAANTEALAATSSETKAPVSYLGRAPSEACEPNGPATHEAGSSYTWARRASSRPIWYTRWPTGLCTGPVSEAETTALVLRLVESPKTCGHMHAAPLVRSWVIYSGSK